MRRVSAVAVGVVLAFLALGAAVLPLQTPAFTRALATRYSLTDEAGLSPERMLGVAEEVRAFVVNGEGTLPVVVDGRPGFDEPAVSHLIDVREVIEAGRMATIALAVAIAAWVATMLARRRVDRIAEALTVASVMAIALPIAGAAVGLADFDRLFGAFHRLLFAGGTWIFPHDSLLILAFPEPFWVASGVSWATLVAVLAGAYRLVAARLGRAEHEMSMGLPSPKA